jgi:hypothetical protein
LLTLRLPDNLHAERSHAARLVFECLIGVDYRLVFESRPDVLIEPVQSVGQLLRMPDILFSPSGWPRTGAELSPAPERVDGLPEGAPCDLPVLFGRRSVTGHWWDPNECYFGIDVLGTAFWVMTRFEELAGASRDSHERFPGRSSHAVRAGYIDRPLVDETAQALSVVLRRVCPGFTPREHRYSLVLTHDVDRPFKHLFQTPVRLLRSMLGDLKRGERLGVLAAPSRWVRVRRGPQESDPFFTFDWLMDRSERAGLRSAFYFICGHTGGARDGDYEIDHPSLRRLLRRIHSRGHEIGLHGSYNTFRSAATLAQELARLRSVCEQENIFQERWGGRQHVLRFDAAVTPAAWQAAGLDYDATLGFADVAGFRCGTCRPFPLYDHQDRRTLEVLERPLVVMDATLMNSEYEGRTAEQATARIDDLRAACRRAGGEFVLLWHNCQLTAPPWRTVYSRVVEEPACAS